MNLWRPFARLNRVRHLTDRLAAQSWPGGARIRFYGGASRAVNSQWPGPRSRMLLGISLATSAVTFYHILISPALLLDASDSHQNPTFRLDEIRMHNEKADTQWVYRGNRVYDITGWVSSHPGGDVILRASGSDIEPYWDIFTIHHSQDVYEILEQYFIGEIDPRDLVDGKPPAGQIEDPFKADPSRDSSLVVHTSRPCNAESPDHALGSFITSANTFYVRNHLWVPEEVDDPQQHGVTVELRNGDEVRYTVADLRQKFSEHTITATLQCAGNRRAHMSSGARATSGLQWGVGAIGNAEWTGVRLRDVLADAGVSLSGPHEDINHVQFVGAEAYGASIPISKALDQHGDVLLAYAMNGEPLTRDHGHPLRALVPGNVAARSVKWLNRIVLSDEESSSQWQRKDYKCFGPNEGSQPDWSRAVSIQETPVQSAFTAIRHSPRTESGDTKPKDAVCLVEGYAYSGGGRRIVRVDVSADNGATWQQAQLVDADERGSRSWSWRQWRIALPAMEDGAVLCVKAVDDSYNSQPEGFEPYYNFRGNLANGWHRVAVSNPELQVATGVRT